jgi:hypothetical protein
MVQQHSSSNVSSTQRLVLQQEVSPPPRRPSKHQSLQAEEGLQQEYAVGESINTVNQYAVAIAAHIAAYGSLRTQILLLECVSFEVFVNDSTHIRLQ